MSSWMVKQKFLWYTKLYAHAPALTIFKLIVKKNKSLYLITSSLGIKSSNSVPYMHGIYSCAMFWNILLDHMRLGLFLYVILLKVGVPNPTNGVFSHLSRMIADIIYMNCIAPQIIYSFWTLIVWNVSGLIKVDFCVFFCQCH